MTFDRRTCLASACASVVLASASAHAQGPVTTAFTYQGQLRQGGAAVSDLCDFQFGLFDAPSGGTRIGPLLTFDGAGGNAASVNVVNGLFTIKLDFGDGAFAGDARFVEIRVRCPSGAGTYTPLTPRQPICAAPYALFALDSPPDFNLPLAVTIDHPDPAFQIQNDSGHAFVGIAKLLTRAGIVGQHLNLGSAAVFRNLSGLANAEAVVTIEANIDGPGLEVEQTNMGPGAFVNASNPTNPAVALFALHQGLGAALWAESQTAAAVGGSAAVFRTIDPGPPAGTQPTQNAAPTVRATNNGKGHAGQFVIESLGGMNGKAALLAQTDSLGPALRAEASGSSGAAHLMSGGIDGIQLPSATLRAVQVRDGQDAGSAAEFVTQGVMNDDATVFAGSLGRGEAGVFSILNTDLSVTAGNASNALEGRTFGLGRAGFFEINVATPASNQNPALEAKTNGTGDGLLGQNTHPSASVVGVRGRVLNPSGVGVSGEALAPTGGIGVQGMSAGNGVEGTSTGPFGVGVSGNATNTTADAIGVWGTSNSPVVTPGAFTGAGVKGTATAATGMTNGVLGESFSTTGTGVRGQNFTSVGTATFGVVGEVNSSQGTGVQGRVLNTGGTAVHGVAANTTAASTAVGVKGEIMNGSGAAVMGVTPVNSQPSRAVLGINGSNGNLIPDGSLAVAVEGVSTPTSGARVRGVRGVTMSRNGIAVEGLASSTDPAQVSPAATGVLGTSHHPYGVGVQAVNASTSPSQAARGLVAQVSGPGTGIEVSVMPGLGGGTGIKTTGGSIGLDATGSVTGVLSNGNLEVLGDASISQDATVTGTLTVGGVGGSSQIGGGLTVSGTLCATSLCAAVKAFRIDHPLDPANKYLYHTSVESPDMMNIYNGNVETDERGHAMVELPPWFEALNRDFRYQLTVLDKSEDDFVLVKVLRKIDGNRFTIKSSRPHVEVSWQVTGIRQDAWANANRIPVEASKPEAERGKYLHANGKE